MTCTPGGLPPAKGWTRVSALEGYEMSDVAFSSSCNGLAVGMRVRAGNPSGAAILRTSDGGRSFAAADIPPGISLLKGVAVRGSHGWAVGIRGRGGGAIVATDDAGRHWTIERLPRGTSGLDSVSFVDRDHGLAVGGRTILSTTDGGHTWRSEARLTAYFFDVAFVSRSHGWAVGEVGSQAGVFVTTDRGHSWLRQRVFTPGGTLFRVQFSTATNGWAAGTIRERGGRALLLSTKNGGHTWTRIHISQAISITGIRFVTPTQGWIALYPTRGGGEVRFTRDGGRSWVSQIASASLGPGPIVFRDRQNGWLIGSLGLFATTNGGG
jgi:photosystem II stability/assembly factor-like uncharacterized protein